MNPQIVFNAVYAIAAVMIVFLIGRIIQKRWFAKDKSEATNVDTLTTEEPSLAPSASSSQSDGDVSWKDKKLFERQDFWSRSDSSLLPRVAPDEVPHVDKSDYAFGAATPVLASLLPESPERRGEMNAELQRAGFYQPHAWHNLSAFRYVAIMASIIIFGTLLIMVPTALELPIAILLVVMALLGWALPSLYVRSKAADRANRIEKAMPDMVDMLNMCVSQGLTVQDSLKRVGREIDPVYPELAQEIRIVCEQAEVGDLETSLKNFSQRVDIPDVHSLTSMLIQTERMGTSVSSALGEYSDTMRESLRQRADEKANSATFKMLFPVVLCLMPAVYMFLLGPAIVEMSNFYGEGGGRELLDGGFRSIETLQRPTILERQN